MVLYKYIRNIWKKPSKELKEENKERMVQWRKEPRTVRILRPTRLDRARSLGYKPKQGVVIVRQRVSRGGRMRPNIVGGRSPKKSRQMKVLDINYQRIAEERVARQYKNCEVVGSYEVLKDGNNYWFEVILVDRNSNASKSDKKLGQISKLTNRVFRGQTSAGRKARGLHKKGVGSEKARK